MAARGITTPNDELMRIVLRLYDQDAAAAAPMRPSLLRKPVNLAIIAAAWLVLGSIQLVGMEQAPSRPVADHALPERGAVIARSAAPIIPAHVAVPERQPLRIAELRRAPPRNGRRKVTPVVPIAPASSDVRAVSGADRPSEVKPLDRPASPDRPTPPIMEKLARPAAPVASDDGPIKESEHVAGKPDPIPTGTIRHDTNDAILAIRLQ